jgi:glycosyltransferase domain-containing protein
VADSSSSENKKINKTIIASMSNADILYFCDYSSTIGPSQKIFDAFSHIGTKYCVICADDDFIIPDSINKSVDFLENNPDFTVAHGRYISFYLAVNNKERARFYWAPRYKCISNIFPDPKHRLTEHLANYSLPTFYGVHRTDFIKMIFKETLEFTNDVRFGELLPSMLASIYGKIKCLDVLYAARDLGSANGYPPSLGDYVKDGTYNEKYLKFRSCLATHLNKVSNLSIKESKKVVDTAMSSYRETQHSNRRIWSNKLKYVLDHLKLPDWMNERMRKLYRNLFLLIRMRTDGCENSVDTAASKYYYDDLNKMRLRVLTYSQNPQNNIFRAKAKK